MGANTLTGSLLNRLKRQAVRTKWITAEIDRITALIYFIAVILVFALAIIFLPDFLPKFSVFFEQAKFIQEAQLAKAGIATFSFFAFAFVADMVRQRIFSRVNSSDSLQDKALTVLKYLTALEAIKIHKEDFKESLKDIERYMEDSHWELANYWVDRIISEYAELFLEEVSKKKQR